MKRNLLIATVLLGVLAAVTVFGITAYRTANAAAVYNLAPAQSGAQVGGVAAPMRGVPQQEMDRGPRGGESEEDLAKALGITTDELQAAYQKANEAALAQAVKDGLITQAQADEIKDKGEAFPLGGRWMGWLQQKGVDYDALLAEALGISSADLQAARLEAFNAAIDQAVTDGRMTQEQGELMKARHILAASQSFQDSLKNAYESAVQQAVTDGLITQAQADLILKDNANGFGGPMGAPGGRGGHGGQDGMFGPQAPDNNPPAPQAPSATSSGNGL